MKKILVLGGAGYIGSHTCVELLNSGFEVVVYDNLSNSKITSVKRVEQITGKKVDFVKGDILDKEALRALFSKYKFAGVINFAGLKAVGESVEKPLEYYMNNIAGTVNVLQVMREFEVFNFIFSSSATVYGNPESLPLTEESKVGGTTNPYGTTKLFIERILMDLYNADKRFNIALLRYFNPIGAHESGLIGEDPKGIPNNLVPYITQTAIGKREFLKVFGNDYNTPDGTGVRDYIHVVDLAIGHVEALDKLFTNPGLVIYNLGTGVGYSVLEVLHAMEDACGHKIPYKFMPRRAGDIDACYADASKAKREIGFEAKYGIKEMCESAWKWQSMNPDGFED